MPGTHEWSPFELATAVVESRDEMRREFGALRADLAEMRKAYLLRELADAQRLADLAEVKVLREQIDRLDAWKVWVGRVLIGGVTVQIVAGVLLFFLLRGNTP